MLGPDADMYVPGVEMSVKGMLSGSWAIQAVGCATPVGPLVVLTMAALGVTRSSSCSTRKSMRAGTFRIGRSLAGANNERITCDAERRCGNMEEPLKIVLFDPQHRTLCAQSIRTGRARCTECWWDSLNFAISELLR